MTTTTRLDTAPSVKFSPARIAKMVDHPEFITAAKAVGGFAKRYPDLVPHLDHNAMTEELLELHDGLKEARSPQAVQVKALASCLMKYWEAATAVSASAKAETAISRALQSLANEMDGIPDDTLHARWACEAALFRAGISVAH